MILTLSVLLAWRWGLFFQETTTFLRLHLYFLIFDSLEFMI
jgi:hypothetical protein